jgi:alpha-tubulin suppressor-like RCC1 family protein
VVAGGAFCWGWNDTGAVGDGSTISRYSPTPVTGMGSGVTAIAAGTYVSCAIKAGSLWCWGTNYDGRLGNGSIDESGKAYPTPVQVVGVANRDIAAVSARGGHVCAINAMGGVFCWGANGSGQLGDGTLVPRGTMQPVPRLATGVAQIATGTAHSCARMRLSATS